MQLTEALAELWHARIRSELGFAAEEPKDKPACSSSTTAVRGSR
jgi:cobalamin-dependent methionine synthase I